MLWSWLRMWEFERGDWLIPDGEVEYRANAALLDALMPACPGQLEADGTWTQWQSVLDRPFYQGLKEEARKRGQLYAPHLYGKGANVDAVLANRTLRAKAIDGAMALATDRFDAPWQGMLLNLEIIDPDLRDELNAFYRAITERVRGAGMPLIVSLPCHEFEEPVEHSSLYTYDYGVLAGIADFVDLQGYTHIRPEPLSIGPLWWVEQCIRYAISEGIKPAQIIMGVGNFARYWPDRNQPRTVYDISLEDGWQLAAEHGAGLEWVEQGANGLVCERYADLGRGQIYFMDAQAVKRRLALCDKYGVGVSLFIPGMGDESVWRTIADWKQEPAPRPGCRPIKRPKTGNQRCALMGTGGLLSVPT